MLEGHLEPIRVPTELTLTDFVASLGAPHTQHHGRLFSEYVWHRDQDSILLVDWHTRRETATIPLPKLVDIAAAYA
jgi:hypothetical protein